MSNNIICRKCGSNHFTTKCGRQPEQLLSKSEVSINTQPVNKINNDKNKFIDTKSKSNLNLYRLQISNLPLDITQSELKELLLGWGNIIKIKVINYEDSSVAYIDFKEKEQSEYFINALDKTMFDNNTIYVNSVKFY